MDPIWQSLNKDMIQEVMSQVDNMTVKELCNLSLTNKFYGAVARKELEKRYLEYFQKLVDETYINDRLNLSNENIRKIPPNVQWPQNLKFLWLSRNQLTTLDNVHWPKDLQELYLTNNQLTTLDNAQWPQDLQILSLTNNQLTKIQIQNLKRLLPNVLIL